MSENMSIRATIRANALLILNSRWRNNSGKMPWRCFTLCVLCVRFLGGTHHTYFWFFQKSQCILWKPSLMLHVYNNQFKFYFGSSFGRAVGLAYMVLSAFVSVCLGLPVCRKNYIPENLWNYTARQALRNRMWFLVTSEIKSWFCI